MSINDMINGKQDNAIIIGGVPLTSTPSKDSKPEDPKVDLKDDSKASSTTPEKIPEETKPASPKRTPKKRRLKTVVRNGGGSINAALEDPTAAEEVIEDDGSHLNVPIMSVEISLANPGSKVTEAEVEHNVTQLREDKYGFNVTHPTGRIALELEDDLDDMDNEGDDEVTPAAPAAPATPVVPVVPAEPNEDVDMDDADDIVKQLNLKFAPGMTDDEKEEAVLKELHRRRMEDNKRLGKYDVEDPFIDDEELQFEEHKKNNRDGFFVYYGPYVEGSIKRRGQPRPDNRKRPSKPSRRTSMPMSRSRSESRQGEPGTKAETKPETKTETKPEPKTSTGSDLVVGSNVVASGGASNSKIIIGSLPTL